MLTHVYHLQTVQKIVKSNKHFCSKLGKYRMPFAWSVRSVVRSLVSLSADAVFYLC